MTSVNNQALSPVLFLERTAKIYPQKTALIEGQYQKTYQEFFEDCLALANAFKNLGVSQGDKVAYICRNTMQMLVAHYAVPLCGAILVPINIRLNPAEIKYILEHSETKVLVVEASFINAMYQDMVEHVFVISALQDQSLCPQYADYNDLVKMGRDSRNLLHSNLSATENEPITLNYTSGTTAVPKGALYSHRSAYLNALGECIEVALNKHSVYLWVLPMFHCNGWCFTWAVTAVGATHICMPSFSPEEAINLILRHQVTHLCAAPTVLRMLLSVPNFVDLGKAKNLTIITAGASPTQQLIESYRSIGIKIIHVYGLTETHGPHTIWDEEITANQGSLFSSMVAQGMSSIHGVFTRVVDNNMQDVPSDGKSLGEVVMRGNNVMIGYYKDTAKTEAAFKDGWFHSGDLAVVHQNGAIEIKDRIKDIIISGGEKISSIEVENVIYQIPGVLCVAVIAAPNEKWGEVPHAVIELQRGFQLSEEEVLLYCRARLAHFKSPKLITFQPIPRTTTGKVQKHLLKQNHLSSYNYTPREQSLC